MAKTKVDQLLGRYHELKTARVSFLDDWKELARHINPRTAKFDEDNPSEGGKSKRGEIINGTAGKALEIATAGMLAGITSPARPWFQLRTFDDSLMESQAVKQWLDIVRKILLRVYAESNFYPAVTSVYRSALQYGTGSMEQFDNFDTVARFKHSAAGRYCLAQDENQQVTSYYKRFQMTAHQLVTMFGEENLSTGVKNMLRSSSSEGRDNFIAVVLAIEPNDKYTPGNAQNTRMGTASYYFEEGGGDKKLLRSSGFNEFPIHTLRWDLTSSEDVYGTDCPGLVALGDIKQLQILEKRKLQALELQINPPLTGPASLQGKTVTGMPGSLTLFNAPSGQKLEPVVKVQLPFAEISAEIAGVEDRINKAFFVDLFQAISTMKGIQPRNQMDLLQRHQERLLQLGPVLLRGQGEFLDKIIDRTFNQCARAGILPPAPEELAGQQLNIKYTGALILAQDAAATQAIEQGVGFLSQLSQIKPDILDKIDLDQTVDEYATAIGMPPSIIVPDDLVQKTRQARAQQAAQAQAVESAEKLGRATQSLAAADTGGQNVLTDMRDAAGDQ